jgi:two-component system NtrC family sensor kinase
MTFRVRHKLVLLVLVLMAVVSFGFTLLNVRLSRALIEEDLKDRAIAFAREVAVTIGDRREFEDRDLLQRQIQQILTIRGNVTQIDVLSFGTGGSAVVASSHPPRRVPFTHQDAEQAQRGQVVSRLVGAEGDRYWEVLAPIALSGTISGAVAAKFSLGRAEAMADRAQSWALGLTAASVLVTGFLMSLAVRHVVDRPIRRFLEAISLIREHGGTAPVRVGTADEFGILAQHFNEMMARISRFSDELQSRVTEATGELDERYRELQRLNSRLFELQRSLSRAERLAVSGQVMAEVAHEVGTPLHSVAGHIELLRQELPAGLLDGDVARRLGIVEVQLARVTEIIAKLLAVTRGSPTPLRTVDLNRLVEATAELVRPGMAAAGLEFSTITEPQPPRVQGDPSQLQQVILNLLTNAIDATPRGGRVEIVTRTVAAHGLVTVEVRDTGPGVPAALEKQIFEPFFSTKAPGQGSGLGLFISAQIVRDHRGTIEVAGREGSGGIFRILLPTTEDAG